VAETGRPGRQNRRSFSSKVGLSGHSVKKTLSNELKKLKIGAKLFDL